MSVKTDFNRAQMVMETYRQQLDKYTDEQFVQSPAEGVWSLSEVYSHILSANIMCASAIAKCIKGDATEYTKGLDWRVKVILFFGRIPGKHMVPKSIAGDVKVISKADALRMMDIFDAKIQTVIPDIDKASPTQTTRHPRMGMFNAKNWLRFIYVHSNHHLKQLARIEKLLV